MARLAELRWLRRRPLHLSQSPRPLAWPRRPAKLRSVAEDMLREMAFVYKATRSVRESMLEEAAGTGQHQTDPLAENVLELA